MPSLSAAHFGYNHQDCVTACGFATLLLPKFGGVSVTVDRKVITDDQLVPQNDALIEISRILEQNSRVAICKCSWVDHWNYSIIQVSGSFNERKIIQNFGL